jgi:hypothetical protein
MAAALIGSSYAVEYVTLTDTNPSASLNPAVRVEVVGLMNQSSGAAGVDLTIDGESAPKGGYVREGSTFSGLSLIRLNVGNAITLKITKSNEINAVAPTSLLVIPENSTGNYNIVVETSSDTATWTPFHSQTVSAADAKRFFRTRIVKAE